MFARHLLSTTALSTAAAYRKSDRGVYGDNIEWSLDRAANTLFRTPLAGFPTTTNIGEHNAEGRTAAVQLIDGTPRVRVFSCTNEAFVYPPTATFPFRAGNNEQPLTVTLSAQISRNNPSFSPPSNAYEVRYFDHRTSALYRPLVVPLANLRSANWGYGSDGEHFYAATGSFHGFKQASSEDWHTVIAASNGRGRRATIPRQVFDEQAASVFVRLNASPVPERIAFSAWRRPLTSDTRVRATSVLFRGSGGNTRRGKIYVAATVRTYEIEISPASGTGIMNGGAVSYHTLSDHQASYTGWIVISGASTSFIVTGQAIGSQTLRLGQYLNADGSPSGEYGMPDFLNGSWLYSPPLLRLGGASPYYVTASNLLTIPFDAQGNAAPSAGGAVHVLDLAGEFVKTGSFPPDSPTIYPLLNADVFLSSGRTYSTCWASYDLLGSWQRLQLWGPRGSTDPAFSDTGRYPTTAELGALPRHFYV